MSTKNVGFPVRDAMIKIKKRLPEWVLIPLIALSAGLGLGTFTGSGYIRAVVFNRAVPLAIFMPAADLILAYRLINSSDPLERLAGYYSSAERGSGGLKFLAERYPDEDHPAVKRAIVYVMGLGAGDRSRVLDFYSEIYGSADRQIKDDILAAVSRMGEESLREFTRRSGIVIPPSEKKGHFELRHNF